MLPLRLYFLFTPALVFGENVYEFKVAKTPLRGFKWGNCNTTIVPVAFSSFSIYPDPIKGGTNIYMSFDLEVTKEIGTTKNLKLDMNLTLETQGTPIELCRYYPMPQYCHIDNFCKMLADKTKKCPYIVKKLGNECRCPLKENTYSVSNLFYPFPEVPIEGLFRARLNLSESEKPVSCLEFSVCIGEGTCG